MPKKNSENKKSVAKRTPASKTSKPSKKNKASASRGISKVSKDKKKHVSVREYQDLLRRFNKIGEHCSEIQMYFDLVNVILLALDHKGKIKNINPKGAVLLGGKQEEIIGKDWFSNFIPKDIRTHMKSVFINMMGDVQQERVYAGYRNRILTLQGKDIVVEWNNVVMRDAGGKAMGTLSSGIDVTARVEAERLAQDEQLKFRRLFESSGAAHFLVRRERKGQKDQWLVFDCNDTALKIFGYGLPEEVTGKSIKAMMAKGKDVDCQTILDRIKPFDKESRPQITECLAQRKDGTRFECLVSAVALEWKGKDILDVSVRDMSELSEKDKQNREAHKRIERYFNASTGIMLSLDVDGKINMINDFGASILGMKTADLVGQDWFQFIPDDNRDELRRIHKENCLSNIMVPHAQYENAVITDEGVKNFLWSNSVMRNEAGSVVEVIAFGLDMTELTMVKVELEKEKEKFRKVFETSSDAVMLLDDKQFFDANSATVKLFGCKTMEEFIGKHPGEVSPPVQPDGTPSKDAANERIAVAFEKGSNFFEWTHRRADGSDFPATVLLTPLELDGKQVLQATVRDISDQKEIERSLNSERRKFKAFFENAPIYCYIVDARGTVRDVNQEALDVLGYNKDELIGGTIMKIYGKGNSKAQDAFKLWLKQGFLKDVQLSIRTKSGESRNVLLNVSSILGDIEGESLAIGVQHDITERKEAQAKLETVISQAKPVILVVGDDRKISMCSGQDVATLGISSERALGKTVEDVFGELRGLSTLLDKAFAGERVTELFESEKITWEITISPMTLGGEVNAVVVSAADVTEQRKSEMRLLALDRLKSRFITALTHVTRTPLNRIRWSLESIKSGDFGDISPEESNLIQQALDSESEVLHVIQNMNLTLDVERDSLSLETMPASLVSIVRSVKNLYENNPNFEGVEWSEEIPNEDIKPINLDTEKMRIALTAIIDNAVRYPGEGKHLVTVKVNGVGEKTRCSVKDNGIGIPGSEQAYIFDRFFRASNAHLKHPNGMGLGLHITKAIIEAHGGEMGFNSEEGLGTEVWFELPHKE